MKIIPVATKASNATVNGARQQPSLGLAGRQALLSSTRTQRNRIQWPTGEQLQDVSKHLIRISREGKRSELAGDYFKSGDLAYQVQEIIRHTGELLKKSQRTKT